MKIVGVYKIQSIIKPERIYIGSTVDMVNRWWTHLYYLRNGDHHSPKLQRHYNKYGEDDLVFEIIETGDYLCKEHLR
jgi:group I intron endonuclease